ncbi:MAG: ABC transporter permease subunit [Planctomycetota bacterium]
MKPTSLAGSSVSAGPRSSFVRKWGRFRAAKLGWYSFLLLGGAYALSFLAPLVINQRALAVRYNGEWFFPIVSGYHEAKKFGQVERYGECNYRALQREFDARGGANRVVLPLYPFQPNESLLQELPGSPPHSPNYSNWLGTDDRGRDVLARLVYGFNISMTFALGVVGIAYLIGVVVGAILGMCGGLVDLIGLRIVEAWSGIPFFYIIMIISSVVARPPLWLLVALVAAFSWIAVSYYVRGEFLREKSRDYVMAAVALGESRWWIMVRHILPNSLTPLLSLAPIAISGAISALVALDFLGFGLPVPTPSWGELLDQGLRGVGSGHWHLILSPIIALGVTLLLVAFIGEAVRAALDPRSQSRQR